MRGEVDIEKIGRPVCNKILIQVKDTFDEFKTPGGIDIINCVDKEAWADSPGFTISEFIIRYGKVVRVPFSVSKGSFDYETTLEVKPGDIVYMNSISFKEHTPLVCEGEKYLLVDYHEVIFRIRNGEITPVNGFCLFKAVPKETTVLQYTTRQNITERWLLTHKPDYLNKELNPRNEFIDIWEKNDIVHLLVRDKPFKIQGDINKSLKVEYFAAPLKMILCAE